MVGRDVELIVPKGPAKPGDVVLHVKDLVVRDDRLEIAVNGLDLEVRAGEIVAIAGVQGNGQTELVEAITGLRAIDSGEITIGGRHVEKATPAPGLGHRRRAHPGGPWPRRAHRVHERRRELHPRHATTASRTAGAASST